MCNTVVLSQTFGLYWSGFPYSVDKKNSFLNSKLELAVYYAIFSIGLTNYVEMVITNGSFKLFFLVHTLPSSIMNKGEKEFLGYTIIC